MPNIYIKYQAFGTNENGDEVNLQNLCFICAVQFAQKANGREMIKITTKDSSLQLCDKCQQFIDDMVEYD